MIDNFKGIILAGGKGTRLHPLTEVVSKQLLPVYDRPMIFYPIEVFVKAGIKDILIITNPEEKIIFERLIGNGSQYDCKIDYDIQPKPEGIAQAFLIASDWLNGSPATLILGDNIFLKGDISNLLKNAIKENIGSTVFAYQVDNPNRYGVIEIDNEGSIKSLEEKPENPKSDWAVTGLYVYNNKVVELTKTLKPSKRNELEITSLNNIYIKKDEMKVVFLPKDSFWLDAGTIDSLLDASNIVKKLKHTSGDIF
ncbi:MAG: glucose-1-phosphate thymidylyltransferase [Gammaproteobacteria bacterium]|jgi:glucose-1-phosphate thymidylyltransferase|nr:glucose-1-phosphate thymidylyltransferase [Gammaproteobacteria bacterium]|tara:strand:+ start:556 stop:1314 length:759 start_codon:yes stop_codon:yes gene_type:complete